MATMDRKKKIQLAKLLSRYREFEDLDAVGNRRCDRCGCIFPISGGVTVTRNQKPMSVVCDSCMKKGRVVIEHLEMPSRFKVSYDPHSKIEVYSSISDYLKGK